MAVLETQQAFEMDHNNGKFRDTEGPVKLPEEYDRLKYLGYFLAGNLEPRRPIRITLAFGRPQAGHPFIMVLKAFSLLGTHRFRLVQGLSLTQAALANASGTVSFDFEPLDTLLRDPSRITGFQVWLMKPKVDPKSVPTLENVYTEPEGHVGVLPTDPQPDGFKHIDTRV
jgi:hypothetical protein